ncbi:MAG: hypothetical protein AAGK00_00525 [Pseudomonadota bacterium]
MPDLTKESFVQAELVWLLEGCLSDLREAAANPASVKYEALLAICETTSALVKRIDTLGISRDEPEAARSAPEISMEKIELLNEVLSFERQYCKACGGWRRIE